MNFCLLDCFSMLSNSLIFLVCVCVSVNVCVFFSFTSYILFLNSIDVHEPSSYNTQMCSIVSEYFVVLYESICFIWNRKKGKKEARAEIALINVCLMGVCVTMCDSANRIPNFLSPRCFFFISIIKQHVGVLYIFGIYSQFFIFSFCVCLWVVQVKQLLIVRHLSH